MTTPLTTVVDGIRRPEHTGADRCTPCTVVNVLIAALLSVAIALVARPLGSVPALLLAGAVLLVSVAAIYLRGYLVPGTPWITETYFPDWLLRLFEDDPTVRPGSMVELGDVEASLERAGVVTDCDGEVCLTDEFRAEWRDRIADLREGDTARAAFMTLFGDRIAVLHAEGTVQEPVEVEPERLSFETFGDAYVALIDHVEVDQWESRAAFIAEVAGADLLRDRYEGWMDLEVRTRNDVLRDLRAFLRRCPSCDGPVAAGDDPVESCCRSVEAVAAMTCQECGARVFETEHPRLGAPADTA